MKTELTTRNRRNVKSAMAVTTRSSSHIERRLGFLKTNEVECEIATVSGASFFGRVVSFDETAIVLQPTGTTSPSALVTVAMRGLEFLAPSSGRKQPYVIEG